MVKVANSCRKIRAYAVHVIVNRLVAFEQPYLASSSKRQLLMYSMDKRVRFSILILTLVSQNDSREELNFILGYVIDYLRDYSYITLITQKSKLLLEM